MRIVHYAEVFATKVYSWIFGRSDPAVVARKATSDTLKIVYAYSAALSLPRAAVADEADLPYPKPRIKAALVDAMGLARQQSMRLELRNAYLRLACWQALPVECAAARVDDEIRQLNAELEQLDL